MLNIKKRLIGEDFNAQEIIFKVGFSFPRGVP